MEAAYDVDEIRRDFPILSTKVNGKPLVYLDSAATSQKPIQVIDAISNYYRTYNSNIHRGMYDISIKATEEYERSKELAAKFLNAGSYRSIVYTKNVTDSINLVALSWGEANIKEGDTILVTAMEHHSNIVPWQLLAKRKKARLEYVGLKDGMFVDMEDLKEKLGRGPKLFAFTHVSNVLGTINPAKEMTEMAHKAGATVLVDGAQAAPHMKVDVRDIGCEFYGLSSHKMLGPAGIGVLYGKEELLEAMEPVTGGGDMIRSVSFDESTWNELPWKFEAGTPNVEGGIGFGAAIEYLNRVGMSRITENDLRLIKYALKRLGEDSSIQVYGPGLEHADRKIGAIPFNINHVHPHDVATIFNSEGVAIRAGHHCAMPLVTKLIGEPAVSRMSFYLYNKEEEVDRAVDAIEKVKKVLRVMSQ
jgi:cysteine desulfurase/selenocysteine lyase